MTKAFSGAIIFKDAETMMTAMFGPPQHDQHVKLWAVLRKDRQRAAELAEYKEMLNRRSDDIRLGR